jgi:hypothetical protein
VDVTDARDARDVSDEREGRNARNARNAKDTGRKSIRKLLMDERGSLSVVIIGLFFLTIACLVVMSNVATVLVAKRSLAQATEAAAQRGVHTLDKSAYYTGKGTMFTTPFAKITGREHSPIPIDCNRAFLDVVLELRNWSNDDSSMKRHELQGIVLTNMECDGSSLEISTYSEVKFPFKVPFLNMDSAVLTSTVGTTNQVREGLYLFGVRLH